MNKFLDIQKKLHQKDIMEEKTEIFQESFERFCKESEVDLEFLVLVINQVKKKKNKEESNDRRRSKIKQLEVLFQKYN